MEFKREKQLQRLLNSRHNGMIKIITGMRRCGKSYLLFNLFGKALLREGVDSKHIIKINLFFRPQSSLEFSNDLYKAFLVRQTGFIVFKLPAGVFDTAYLI